MKLLAALLMVSFSLVACGKKEPPPPPVVSAPAPEAAADTATPDVLTVRPEPDTTAPADGAATMAETLAPSGDSAELSRCKDILAKGWAAVKPVIAKLGVDGDAALEARFLGDKNYLDACVALPQDKRDCLAQAENPVAAIATCEINKPKRVLGSYDFAREIKLWPSTPLSKEETDALYKWLQGKWQSDWTQAEERTRWVIGPQGKVESAEVERRGAPDPKANVPETITFTETRKLAVLWKGSTTTQTLAFYKESDDVFYASTNGLYDAFPVLDEKHFVVRHGWEYIAFDNGSCEVIMGSGVALPAKCGFTKGDGRRLFKAEFQRPGAARPTTTTHVVLGKYFLVDAMFEAARFVRQK